MLIPEALGGGTSDSTSGSTSESTSDSTSGDDGADLVDTAIAAKLDLLVAAVQFAGLEETLRSKGPFTDFAPTNLSLIHI